MLLHKNCPLYKQYYRLLIILFFYVTSFSSGNAQTCLLSQGDPYESLNRSVLSFNLEADKYFLKPLSQGYDWVFPWFIKKGVDNVFGYANEFVYSVNFLIQGQGEKFSNSISRIFINGIFGFVGLIDIAKTGGIPHETNDFSQTLHYYSFSSGPYVVLPFSEPMSAREAVGRVFDFNFNPFSYQQSIEITALNVVNSRHSLGEGLDILDSIATDKYSFIKNAYYSRRMSILCKKIENRDPFDELLGDI